MTAIRMPAEARDQVARFACQTGIGRVGSHEEFPASGDSSRAAGGDSARCGAVSVTSPSLKRGREFSVKLSPIALDLATGRILDELRRVAGNLHFVVGVVAENDAIVHSPDSGRTSALGPPVPAAFIAELRHRGIPFRAGQCLVDATPPTRSTAAASSAKCAVGVGRRASAPQRRGAEEADRRPPRRAQGGWCAQSTRDQRAPRECEPASAVRPDSRGVTACGLCVKGRTAPNGQLPRAVSQPAMCSPRRAAP